MDEVSRIIAAEIANRGAIPFFRFMELALYCPDYGFYEGERDRIGKEGDFFTNVSVGPLFGELLAFRFAQWWSGSLPEPKPRSGSPGENGAWLRLVEAGADRGQLASDILTWFRDRRDQHGNLRYYILEPSATRRRRQKQFLNDFATQVEWANSFSDLQSLWTAESAESPTLGPAYTILFSNELLDAFPVRRFGWDARDKRWFEWGVAMQQDRFVWTRLSLEANVCPGIRIPQELAAVLPDGYTVEYCADALAWWKEAALLVPHGKIVAFDYGGTEQDLLCPERVDGTLRSYRGHHVDRNVLDGPGSRDITADVNFTAVEQPGIDAGLRTELFCSQAQFLTAIAEQAWREESGFGEWTAKRTRQLQTLTHPEHLGRSFKVLVQGR